MKTCNKIFLTALVSFAVTSLGIAQITTPRTPSPGAEIKQTIGISSVTVNYSRPAVRGREVWGKLVPYGWNKQLNFGFGNDAPWRAGANENTVITFSHDAKVQGKSVPAGSYGLFFVINEDNTGEVVLSKDYKSWGSFFYDASNDLMRAPIQVRNNANTEILSYDFINLAKTSGELVLNWEKKQFPVKVEFAVDDIVMANAAEELKSTVGFSWQGYNSAANYSLQNKVNLEQGLIWATQAANQNNSFPTVSTKAGLLLALGRADESEQLMASVISTATEPQINIYAYQLLTQGKTDKALEMFLLNSKKYPASANVWDSLGDGYKSKGDSKNAIKAYKKCLSLNPAAAVKAASENSLKELGA